MKAQDEDAPAGSATRATSPVAIRYRLFVYGSLLRGEENHGFLASSAGVTFLGEDRTRPCFRLVRGGFADPDPHVDPATADWGPFPALVFGGDQAVRGEVYELDAATLASLDLLEDHPDLYRRSPIEVERFGLVQAYVMTPERAGSAPVVPGADWRARHR